MSSGAVFIDYLQTPIGSLQIKATQEGIKSVYFVDAIDEARPGKLTDLAKHQLIAYIEGTLTAFDLPLSPDGTDFQRKVWGQLSRIPYGETCSYLHIANQLKNPKAVRAVGAANGKNPISIIVPCHRVIGANGTLTGYAGGLARKSWLLNLENPQSTLTL